MTMTPALTGNQKDAAQSPRDRDPFKAGATPYREVGDALRQSLTRARASKLNGSQWRVLAVVVDLTASRSKLKDHTWCEYIAEQAGFGSGLEPTKRAARTLRKLRGLGVIDYVGGSKKPKRWTVVGLPPADRDGDGTNLTT